jgi:hypothetical protein
MIRERQGQSPPKTTTTGPRPDREYYKRQQEKYRPPKGQLEALLRGARMIRERQKQTTSEGQDTDPYHDPLHPTMSPLVNKRPPDRPAKKGPGLFGKIGAFFSKLGRRSKSPESPPSSTPTSKTDETDPYHDPLHPTMSPLVNKRPPDKTVQETDPYHDPLHPTMSPLVNKRPPDKIEEPETPREKKPGFFARWRAKRKEAKTRKKWGLDKEAWGNMPDVVKKSYMQASVPKGPEEPKKKSAFRERYGGAWKLWGKAIGQRIVDKLFLPPGMRSSDLERIKKQEQRKSPGARKRPGVMERERVSPAKPKEEEETTEKKEETKSTSDEVTSLRETIGELKFRIKKLEEERAKT